MVATPSYHARKHLRGGGGELGPVCHTVGLVGLLQPARHQPTDVGALQAEVLPDSHLEARRGVLQCIDDGHL